MLLEESLNACQKYFLDLTWAHWNRFGATGFGPMNHCSLDPEALLMLTSFVGQEEGRLLEIMGEWIHQHGSLISIERLKKLVKICEKDSSEAETRETKDVFHKASSVLGNIVFKFIPKTQYPKWKKLFHMEKFASPLSEVSSKRIKESNVVVQQNLLMRLRYLFGPGTRSDILYFVLVIDHQKKNPFNLEISSPTLARSLGYNMSSVHRTLNDFSDALILKKKAADDKRMNFILHQSIFKNPRIIEKCFINWFPIVRMVFSLGRLRKSFGTRFQAYDESIIKSRFLRFVSLCHDLARQACIPLKSQISVELPLKDVPLEQVLKMGPTLIKEICEFVTSAKW